MSDPANWRRPRPRLIVIHKIMMSSSRDAARHELRHDEAAVALRLVPSMEGIKCGR